MDFDLLRQELSGDVVDGPQERYSLDWPGKREAIALGNSPTGNTLRPVEDSSVDFYCTKNLLVEGDNLEALKILQESLLGKVKLIYIDPPYNTGKDFVYSDKFKQPTGEFLEKSGQRDNSGNRLTTNESTSGSLHSDWLSMMLPRLRLARNILSEEGVIFISIDDNESHNLKKLCDEVFGEGCFRANIVWRRTVSGSVSGQGFSVSHDHILCYSKKPDLELGKLSNGDVSGYKNPDNDPRGPYKAQKLERTLEGARPTMKFAIETPKGKITKTWAVSKKKYEILLEDNRIVFSNTGMPYYKQFLSEYAGRRAETIWEREAGNNQEGSKELKKLFGKKNIFNNPKPTKLISQMIKIGAPEPDSIVMDFFAGSGTTAHAVLQANAEDGGCRQFIGVQMSEKTPQKSPARKCGFKFISEITRKRIILAGEKLKSRESSKSWNKDVGFRYLKIDTSNFNNVSHAPDDTQQARLLDAANSIKPDRTPLDLLFHVLTAWGLDPTMSINFETIQDKKVFFVDNSALVACFDEGITENLVTELAKIEPSRAVFCDSGFTSDAVKVNVDQIFKQLSPVTDVRVI